MTWTPDDALVEKAARAAMDAAEGFPGFTADLDEIYRAEVRAALIACRDDMVADAVKAENEACAEVAFFADQEPHCVHGHDRCEYGADLDCPYCEKTSYIADAIRARHP